MRNCCAHFARPGTLWRWNSDDRATHQRAKGFQRATAEAALETLTCEDGPRRFLVADEVGLGKTVVARTIISEMIKRRRRPLVVFYVSSNLNIAHQNRVKLLELLPTEEEQKQASAPADRLTLAANPRNRPNHEKLHLYTLTPDTSVPMYRRRGGFGRMEKRALIFRLLKGRFPSLDTNWFAAKCRGNQARRPVGTGLCNSMKISRACENYRTVSSTLSVAMSI